MTNSTAAPTKRSRRNCTLWIKMLDEKWNPVEIKVRAEEIPALIDKWSKVFVSLGVEPTGDRFRVDQSA